MIPASDHAVRRYCGRRLGVLVKAFSDAEALRILRRVGCDTDSIRERLHDVRDTVLRLESRLSPDSPRSCPQPASHR